MRILVTNDDGIHAPGLELLEAVASELSDDVWVCAPSEEQSGMGHALTLTRPVRLNRHGERRFSVSGTPTDSVMLGMRKALDAKPDLILSGINRGANLGDDITYSGTASAAMEGALAGVKSVALSQVLGREAGRDDVPDFAAAREWAVRTLEPLIRATFAERTLFNVNFPPCAAADVRGIRITRQGFHDYDRGSVVEGRDPRGRRYYWFGLDQIEHTLDHGTDLEAVDERYVSVTPLQLDLTHYDSIGRIAELYS